MNNRYFTLLLNDFQDFLEGLSEEEQSKIDSAINFLRLGRFESLYIKTLKSPIKELIVNKYRLIFFIDQTNIYFISAFIKKTAKTPKKEIQNAEKLYNLIIKK